MCLLPRTLSTALPAPCLLVSPELTRFPSSFLRQPRQTPGKACSQSLQAPQLHLPTTAWQFPSHCPPGCRHLPSYTSGPCQVHCPPANCRGTQGPLSCQTAALGLREGLPLSKGAGGASPQADLWPPACLHSGSQSAVSPKGLSRPCPPGAASWCRATREGDAVFTLNFAAVPLPAGTPGRAATARAWPAAGYRAAEPAFGLQQACAPGVRAAQGSGPCA